MQQSSKDCISENAIQALCSPELNWYSSPSLNQNANPNNAGFKTKSGLSAVDMVRH